MCPPSAEPPSAMAGKKKVAYVVKVGRLPGVYDTWADCKAQTNGFPGNKYDRYETIEETRRVWE